MLSFYVNDSIIEVGCDEVGRGSLAGPVVASAVILPRDYRNNMLKDCKLLNKNIRWALELDIKEKALGWAIAEVDNTIIDKINILNASILAMHKALDLLLIVPQRIIVDGNKFKPYKNISHACIVKGDSKFASIAAASILAKNYRDALMVSLSNRYENYLWHTNVGYPTKAHREAIEKYGLTQYHRKTFCKKYIS